MGKAMSQKARGSLVSCIINAGAWMAIAMPMGQNDGFWAHLSLGTTCSNFLEAVAPSERQLGADSVEKLPSPN